MENNSQSYKGLWNEHIISDVATVSSMVEKLLKCIALNKLILHRPNFHYSE